MDEIKKAIEALEINNALMTFDPNTGEDYPIELQNQLNQDLYKANLIAIEILEKQLNNGWISTKERFPKEDEEVLVCFPDGQIRWAFLYLGEWNTEASVYQEEYVVAWQPLPKPYEY